MVYPNTTTEALREKFLEISVWNYDNYKPSEFLGEVILDLANESLIDERARWYKLHSHDKNRYPRDPSGKTRNILEKNGAGRKMTRLNYANGEVKFHPDHHQKFHKLYHRKSVASTESTKVSSQQRKVPMFPTTNLTAHPLMPQGCKGAGCNIF
ncbi:protein piccolo-like [Limulus polyphemus]|uniref:Protein piccolo-like n=1 Tax=Limulus polyphemus TaxID=6850 RepID=A0ABM1TMM7_LIMPO|nr:protein piccolo-like [Limulus polyphemus]